MAGDAPMTAADWQALSSELGTATQVGNIAMLMHRPGFSRAAVSVPDSLDDLAAWAGVWGRMTVELAQWFAVKLSATDRDDAALIVRHMGALCVAGWYPDTLRPDPATVPAEQIATDEAAATALHARWRTAGQPFLALGISAAQTGLRAEARAAAWRAESGTAQGDFIRAIDAINTAAAPSRTMTADELMLFDPHSTACVRLSDPNRLATKEPHA